MEPYRTIVAGVHDTDRGLRATDRAIEVAARSRAVLHLAAATDAPPGAGHLPAGDDAGGVRMEPTPPHVLHQLVDRAGAHGVPDARTVARSGRPVDVLTGLATELGAGLVVVGSHGVNTTAGRVFGSVAAGSVRRAPSDVLIVHTTDERWHVRQARRRRLGPTAAPYRCVLVGVHASIRDSGSMHRVVEVGAEMAAICDAEIVLSSSYVPAESHDLSRAESALGVDDAFRVRGSNPVEATLREARQTAVAVGARAPRTLARAYTPPGRALVTQAAQVGADLVVVGSHGLHAPRRRMVGAVAASVFRHTPADVLVVNTQHHAA
ncbi:universal stress protein [Actinomycetospora endophytica]|uniref:Universal stress protein n=1 Tax=Actinomycetospora endophytica TaxID=2291215 RepID=A0ABS8PF34_9PSEU|nr:universal stress protein [Actinomycetospora endophytica]MCD2196877.1 universal stress protein [Actinomycetospora endophytica]